MRILLLKPPERSAFNFGTYSLGVLAAAVRETAEVSILDATGVTRTEAATAVAERAPQLLGITVMGLDSVAPAAALIRDLRSGGAVDARSPIVVGGHGASGTPGPLLQAGADLAVLGEGELTFSEIVSGGIRPGIAGTVRLVDGALSAGPGRKPAWPLDRLPPAARDLMPSPPDGVHLMETSRGCPHRCSFCETTRFYGCRWRPYSVPRVAAEVDQLVAEHDAWVVHLADDNFTASPRRAIRLCRTLASGALPAFFIAFARGDDLISDPELLPAMAAARILRITVGVETLNLETAKRMGKAIDLTTYREAFRRMRELGMFSVASLIVGLPGEDPDTRRRSVELAVEAGPDSAHFVPFRPLPGTPLADDTGCTDAKSADLRDAHAFTESFFLQWPVRRRLEDAVSAGGIRGLLADGALEHHPATAAPVRGRSSTRARYS